jgi:hypothetical protein
MSAHIRVSSTWKSITQFKIRVGGVWKSVSQGHIRVGGLWKLFFSGALSIPTQTSRPQLTGSGVVGTSIQRFTGTYTNYTSIVNRIWFTTQTSPPADGATSAIDPSNITSVNPYTILQSDANPPAYYFYARDAVLGTNNITYYYYSDPVIATMTTFIDNYNRTVSSGLGTASGGWIYGSYGNLTSSWSTNGSYAINSSAVFSGDPASSHPLQTVTVNSADKNYSIDFPDGKGGKGLAFWTTAADSWYAVASYYDYTSTTGTVAQCTGTTSCDGLNCCSNVTFGSAVGQRCGSCPSATITYPCGQNGVTYTCSGYNCCTNNIGSLSGDYCNCTNSNTASTTQVLTCSGSASGSTCPSTGSALGNRCGTCTSTTTCTGSGSNSYCPDFGSNVGDRCGGCSSSSSTVNTLTGYTFATRASSSSTVYTYGLCRSTSNTPNCPSCPGGSTSYSQYNCSSGNWQCQCATTTTSTSCGGSGSNSYCPDVGNNVGDRCGGCSGVYSSVTTTTYTYSTRQQAYSYSTYANQDVTSYTSNYQTRGINYNYSYNVNQLENTTAYYYNTKIKLFSAVSGTVSVQSWDSPYAAGQVTSNYVIGSFDSTRWIGIYNITAYTNGNTVTATAHDSGGGNIGQSVAKTVSSPTKYNAGNETAAGIIKTYTPNNVGTSYDNLSIN